MCVIAVVESFRLTDQEVQQMYDANPRGGGVAWRETREDGVEVVKWQKGLTVEQMQDMNRQLPFPFILHFRVPSAGTSSSYMACHPFAVNDVASYDLEGETDGFVLFHNGFWTGWKEKIQQIAISGYARIPTGPWSDSRGLAWAANHLGLGLLDMIDEKVVAIGPGLDDIEVFGKWEQIKRNIDGEDKYMLVSNKGWEHKAATTTHLPALAQRAITVFPNEEPGGASPEPSFCGTAMRPKSAIDGEKDQQERVQEAQESTLPILSNEKACYRCKKGTMATVTQLGKSYCWQCWSLVKDTKPTDDHISLAVELDRIGQCEFCRTSYAGARRLDDDRWICRGCVETNGYPAVYYFHDAARVKAERQMEMIVND